MKWQRNLIIFANLEFFKITDGIKTHHLSKCPRERPLFIIPIRKQNWIINKIHQIKSSCIYNVDELILSFLLYLNNDSRFISIPWKMLVFHLLSKGVHETVAIYLPVLLSSSYVVSTSSVVKDFSTRDLFPKHLNIHSDTNDNMYFIFT